MSVAASDRIRTREPFDFRGTRMRIHLSSADTGGSYPHCFTTIADRLRRSWAWSCFESWEWPPGG